jgi:F-type H+-transporting ATPase subunit alpha
LTKKALDDDLRNRIKAALKEFKDDFLQNHEVLGAKKPVADDKKPEAGAKPQTEKKPEAEKQPAGASA